MVLKTANTASQYAVMVEQESDGTWLAQVLGWSECRTQALNREDAIEELQRVLNERLSKAEVLYYNAPVSPVEHPWMKDAGMYKNDPSFEEVLENIAEYRRELDSDRPEMLDL